MVGTTLVHCDLRADNLLLDAERTWIVDWPHAAVGAAWVDFALLAPSVAMQGGPRPEALLAAAGSTGVDEDAMLAVAVGLAGYFVHASLQPAPPGLPTLRAFQAAQGATALAWVRRLARLG